MILNAHKYIGQVDSKGRAHGYGILKYDNGSMYEGSFLGDKRHGLGIWTQYGGAVIVGEFEKNLSSGRRTIYQQGSCGVFNQIRTGWGVPFDEQELVNQKEVLEDKDAFFTIA